MRRIALVLLALCLGGLACSDDDADTSSFCEDRDDLRASIEDLRDVNVLEDGIEELDSNLDTVLQDVDTMRGSASELTPEVDAVRSSVEALQASVTSASTPADKATALVEGLSDLSVAWDSLDEAAGSECD
jgi:phage shock protein A